MKKIIISMIASVAILLGAVATTHAEAVFNSPGEMPTVTVTNAVTNPCSLGPINGCWQQSTTARPGDVIAVHIYYKNTSNEPAQNTTLSIQPSRNGTNVSFYGGVASTSGPRSTGTARVTLSAPAAITYMSSGNDAACWRPSASSPCQSVDPSALFGGGFSIGTVNPGEQGVLVARFRVDGASNPTDECEIDSFTADDYSIDRGDSTELTWRTTDCDYVTLTSVSGNLNPDSSRTVHPNSTTTYTLRAYTNNGTLGDSQTLTISVDNNDDECEIDSFTASPTSIDRGDNSTLRWNTSGDVDYVTISGISGNRNEDGSASVSPYSTTTYTLRAYCNDGSSSTDTVSVRVNNTQVSTQPQAITTVATILSGSQARLNGIAVPNTSDSSTRAWFEWGTSGAFGNRTNSQTVASGFASQYYSDVVSGLVPGGVYYYRAVVQNNNGIAYGDTVRFQTQRTTVVTTTPPVIVRSSTTTSTVVAKSAPSLLELRVESNYDHMCVGGFMDYTITYRNLSTQTLENTVLRFTHPKEITYVSSSRGEYEVVDRTMTIDLGSVRPGEEGTITIHARVNETAIRGNLTVATATVVYTNTVTRGQEDAIAYALITVSDTCPNVLGASVVGFGSFLPATLLGWLLLILVILALIVLGRQFYKKNERVS